MFSQYSWWDFIKFVLILAVPYYAFVLWKYYREDIREWIINRGQSTKTTHTTSDNEEEDIDDTGLYTAKNYAPDSEQEVSKPKPSMKPEGAEPSTAIQSQDVDLPEGVIVGDDKLTSFELPVAANVERLGEQSLATIIEVAKGLSVNEKGTIEPTDPADKDAAKLSAIINQQQGNTIFGNIPFTR